MAPAARPRSKTAQKTPENREYEDLSQQRLAMNQQRIDELSVRTEHDGLVRTQQKRTAPAKRGRCAHVKLHSFADASILRVLDQAVAWRAWVAEALIGTGLTRHVASTENKLEAHQVLDSTKGLT